LGKQAQSYENVILVSAMVAGLSVSVLLELKDAPNTIFKHAATCTSVLVTALCFYAFSGLCVQSFYLHQMIAKNPKNLEEFMKSVKVERQDAIKATFITAWLFVASLGLYMMAWSDAYVSYISVPCCAICSFYAYRIHSNTEFVKVNFKGNRKIRTKTSAQLVSWIVNGSMVKKKDKCSF